MLPEYRRITWSLDSYFQIEDILHHSPVGFLTWFPYKELLRIKRYNLVFLPTSATDSHGHTLSFFIITGNCTILGILTWESYSLINKYCFEAYLF